ncbi:hypothetical protein O3597_26980 [Verrucosispora sp. WMMA2044]|uniref:hypothetical protein n=1 Tax=Verrucosispora sp. WMMA2044 TaxID=3016419 RepID=UPI00248B629F|nr:hypothetical protein [Verrucosispora sp. WMMA2044]WBB48675.1 hypothetical protein O3597_26980 [Verrucosispora sp. WMMA2044]
MRAGHWGQRITVCRSIVLAMSGAESSEPPRRGRLDRHRDLTGYVLTPLYTLVGTPLVACLTALLAEDGQPYPSVCDPVRAANGCEERVLGIVAGHVLSFAALWLLLWVLPWWRGLRLARILLAVIASAVVVALVLRID